MKLKTTFKFFLARRTVNLTFAFGLPVRQPVLLAGVDTVRIEAGDLNHR